MPCCVCSHLCGCRQRPEGVLDPLELESPKEGMNCPVWVLGTKLKSSEKAAITISHRTHLQSCGCCGDPAQVFFLTLLHEAASFSHTRSSLVWLLSLAHSLSSRPEPRKIEHPLLAAVGTAHTCPDKHRHRRISVRSRSTKQFPGLVP